MNRARVFWRNAPSLPRRWMARYLRRHGWVVFYLDETSRHCGGVCWLREYERGEGRTRNARIG